MSHQFVSFSNFLFEGYKQLPVDQANPPVFAEIVTGSLIAAVFTPVTLLLLATVFFVHESLRLPAPSVFDLLHFG